jgi:ribosome-binding factor A
MAKKRPFVRTDRLSSQVREVLAMALQRETREAILREVVITDVAVTSDVSLARVYWHALPGVAEADVAAVEAAFQRASGFLRSKVGEAVRARLTPELRFIHDDALDRGRRIEDVLRHIAAEREADAPATPPADAPDRAATPKEPPA